MALKRRCSLCGERLDSSMRCTACGLDNTKNDSMYKNLINQNDCEDQPLTHVHEEPKVNKNYGKVTYTYKNKVETAKPVVRTVRNTTSRKKKPFTLVKLIVILMILFSTIIPALATIISELSYGIQEEVFPEYEYTPECGGVSYSTFGYDLGAGFYEIGIHLPEGEYTISMKNGEYASVDLYEFDGTYWGNTDFWYFDVYEGETVHEVWLEAGDFIVINAADELEFVVPWYEGFEAMDEENVVWVDEYETFYISGTVVAGQDFPAGVYDFCYLPNYEWEEGYVSIAIADFYEYGGEHVIGFNALNGESYYYNVPLTPGTIIHIDESIEGFQIFPSAMIGRQMYDVTWDAE